MLSVQQFLTKNGMTPIPHPTYSPDLTQTDFFFVFLDEKSPQGKQNEVNQFWTQLITYQL